MDIKKKAIWGTFLNLAKHNAYIIINILNERLGGSGDIAQRDEDIEKLLNDSKVFKALRNADKKDPEQQLRAIEGLTQHFPFLRYWEKTDTPGEAIDHLMTSALRRLNMERNFFSHYYPQDQDYRHTYVRAEAHDEDANPTKQQAALTRLWDEYLQFLGEENSPQRQIAIRRYYELSPQNSNFTDRDRRKLHEDLNKQYMTKKSYRLFDEDPHRFTDFGRVFFTCLFLDKRQAEALISQTVGLKSTRSLKERMTRKACTHHCCRMPKPRLMSGDLVLDILGELRRCPKELFRLLSEPDKQEAGLLPQINPEAALQRTDEEGNPLQHDTLIRNAKEDRFPHLALRYFDTMEAFKGLRFQLRLGKLTQQAYRKKMDGEERDRLLLKELHGFARLPKISAEGLSRDEGWRFYLAHTEKGDVNPNPVKAGDIVQFSPRYHIKSKTIAIKLTQADELPEIFKCQTKHNRPCFKAQNAIPDATLSIHELPNLFLYHFLEKKGVIRRPVESLIRQYQNTFQKIVQDIKCGDLLPIADSDWERENQTKKLRKRIANKSPYEPQKLQQLQERKDKLQAQLDQRYKKVIHWSNLPSDMRDYLLGVSQTDYKTRALSKLINLREETEKRLKDLNKDDENQKAGERTRLKPGDVASWLAQDMIYLKRPNKKYKNDGKPNRDQYRHLQRMLALYGEHKEQLRHFMIKLGLLGTDQTSTHPFLSKIISARPPTTWRSFYRLYLQKRRDFPGSHNADGQVRGIKEEAEGKYNSKQKKLLGGLSPTEIDRAYGYLFDFPYPLRSIQEKDYCHTPTRLPVGLFNAEIREGFRQLYAREGLDLEEKDVPAVLWQKYLRHDCQNFYTRTRHYTLPEKANISTEERQRLETAAHENLSEFLQELKTAIQLLQNKLSEKERKTTEIAQLKEDTAYQKEREEFMVRRNFRDHILETEKSLRYLEHTDRCLWQMAQMIQTHDTQSERITVDFAQATLRTLTDFLEGETSMSVPIPLGKDKVSYVFNTRKLKDYGELRQFAKDRRLPNLFAYFKPGIKLKETDLEAALQRLERGSVSSGGEDQNIILMLQKVMELEQAIHERYEKAFLICCGYEKGKHIEHEKYLKFLTSPECLNQSIEKLLQWNGEDRKKVNNIRNKLIHNEFPTVSDTEGLIQGPKDGQPLEDFFHTLLNKCFGIYDELTSSLSQK